MTWAIEWVEEAAREFRTLRPIHQKAIWHYLINHIASMQNPCDLGKPLQRNLAGLWRYCRIGYRIICRVQSARITVLIVKVDHDHNRRKDV